MLIAFNAFGQPALNGVTATPLIGKPIYPPGTIIRFIKFGTYQVEEVQDQDTLTPEYTLRIIERYPGSPSTVPAGTVAYLEEEDLTIGTLSYNPTIFLDFRGPDYQTVSLSNDVVFAAQQHFPGRAITIRVRNTSGINNRNLSFPTSWIFLGDSGRPSIIGPSKTGILSITSFGTSDADVIAVWGVQPDN